MSVSLIAISPLVVCGAGRGIGDPKVTGMRRARASPVVSRRCARFVSDADVEVSRDERPAFEPSENPAAASAVGVARIAALSSSRAGLFGVDAPHEPVAQGQHRSKGILALQPASNNI